MNLKDWAKIDEDDSTVTMEHPSGHTMKIAVRALPKIQQEQIRRLQLARGGDILDSGEEGMSEQGRIIRHANKTRGEDHQKEMYHAKEEAKGRAKAEKQMPKPKIKGLAEGGSVEKDRQTFANITKKQTEIAKSRHEEKERAITPEQRAKNKEFWRDADRQLKEIHPGQGPIKKEYADGSDETVSQDDSAPTDQPQAQPGSTHITINAAAAPAQVPQVPGAIPVMQATAPQANVPSNLQTPQVTGGSLNKEAINSLQATSGASAAYDKQAEIDAAQSKAMIPAVQQSMKQEQAIQQARANAYNDISQHTGDYAKYIDQNPEDVKRYIKNMDTGPKIANGIALFLGGFGTAFGGHNFAFDHIQNMINKDLEAQRDNIHNKKTVLGAYQALYGNNQAALDAAKISMNDMVAKQAQLTALQLGTPQAQVKNALLKEQLLKNNEQLRNNGAGQLQMSGMTGGKPSGGAPAGSVAPQKAPGNEGAKNENVYHILAPGARNAVDLAKIHPLYKNDADKMDQQYTAAEQAERVLNGPNNDGVGGIHDLLQQMYKNSGSGSFVSGFGGHVRRSIEEAGHIPYAGDAIKALTDVVPQSEAQKQYSSAQNTLETDLATALNGIVAPTDVQRIIRSNLPAYGDKPDMIAYKEKAIANSIKKAVRQSNLGKIGALYKEPKGK